jgi:hypothetical protein
MHPPEVREAAVKLVAEGLNDCEVSRRMGIPRSTIRDWRRPIYQRRTIAETCPRCWLAAKPMRFSTADYVELLALYLGDGCISEHPRTQRLRVALDMKYPQIIRDAQSLLKRCFPDNRVDAVPSIGCVYVSIYSSHLSCLFPQHGRGRKHDRPITLEPWQVSLVADAPWPLLRGLVRTDGCVFINRTGPYEYLSYDFTNMSSDIVELFVGACEQVGVVCRVTQSRGRGIWRVRINRRASVALMLEQVGLKC